MGSTVVERSSAGIPDPHAVLDAISDAVVAIDSAGRVTYWGPGAAALYEVAPEEALGRPLTELYAYRWEAAEDEARALATLERDGSWRGRNVHVLRSGAVRYVESTVTVLRNDDGGRAGLLAVIRDETARVEAERARDAAEEALRATEARYRNLFQCLIETIFVYEPVRDDRGEVVDVVLRDANPAALAQVGRPLADLVGRRATDVFGAEAMRPFLARLAEVARTGAPQRWESPFDWDRRQYVAGAHLIDGGLLVATGVDVTDWKRAQEALRESEERARVRAVELETVLDTVPAAVWIARDPRGDRIDANRLGAELLRRRPGENVSVTAPGEDRPRHFVVQRAGQSIPDDELPIQRAARFGEEIRGAGIDLLFEDGQRLHLVGNATPLRDGEGRVKGSVGAFIDVTDRVKAEERLRDSDRRKTEFLAVLSHELRNPLASIRNSLVVLDHAPPDSPAVRRARDVLHRQTQQLSRLVDDLLDISRIAHGKIEVQLARLDAREVARRAYADAKALFDERDVELVLSDSAEPLWIDADAARLAQMIGNLLHNALKFTPPRGHVQLKVARRGAACAFGVRDTGAGLEAAELERIFDPFVQAERSSRGQGGLGLGLALVRELASKHGGTVRAESPGLGRGAEFVVELPLSRAPERPVPARGEAERAAGVDVLIVEDNEDAAATLADLLALTGHTVRTAPTGRAGIDAALAARPDVLVCDVGLPDLSGHDVVRAIRAAERDGGPEAARVFAIALTGYAQPQDRAEALAAGFDAHLPKPPPLEELAALLADVARRRRGRAAPST